METLVKTETPLLQVKPVERLAYSVHEVADMLGINYFSVYRLIHGEIAGLSCDESQIARATDRSAQIVEAGMTSTFPNAS
jgi:hypothetical protein